MVAAARDAASAAIDLRGVTKTFGSLKAVDHLDLVIPRGALYGFIGPNGAGKTTTIRMVMSILSPTPVKYASWGTRRRSRRKTASVTCRRSAACTGR